MFDSYPQRGIFGRRPVSRDMVEMGEADAYVGSELEDRLNIQHPQYVKDVQTWEEIKDFVEGSCREKATKYTPPHIGEDPDVYMERVRTFTYTPVLARAVRSFVACLSKGSVTINTQSKGLQRTLQIMNPLQFASDSMRSWILYGALCCTYDIVDDVIVPVLIDPITCINWGAKDEKGGLEFAVLKTHHIRTKKLEKPQKVERWQVYDESRMTTYEKVDHGSVKITKQVPLNGCPVLRFEPPREGWTAAQAIGQQRAYTTIENARLLAGRSMYIQRTITPVMVPDDDMGETYNDVSSQTTFNNNTLTCDKFEFVEPPGSSVESLGGMLKDIETQIRSLISMRAQDTQSAVESGESKRYDYAELSMTLQFIGDHLRQWLKRVMEMLATQLGDWTHEGEIEVAGLNSFEVNNLEFLLAQAHSIESIRHNITPTALESFYAMVNSLVAGAQTRDQAEQMRRELKQTLKTPAPEPRDW